MAFDIHLKQRLNAGFILVISFLFVFASNRINKKHHLNIERNVNSIFENRIVAQGYLYQLNNHFHEKEQLLTEPEKKRKNFLRNSSIDDLLTKFASTELTKNEALHFRKLKINYSALKVLENKVYMIDTSINVANKYKTDDLYNRIGNNLDDLSKVQFKEGKLVTELSKKSLQMNQILGSLEIAFLVIIGMLLLLIIRPQYKKRLPIAKLNA